MDKKTNPEKHHSTEMILTISNWHFVRDNVNKPKVPPCTPDDCTIGFKLSSTVFRSGGDSPTTEGETNPETGEKMYFDRNGALIPYAAFKVLIQSADLAVYMEQVKTLYEKDVGSAAWSENDEEDLENISAQRPQEDTDEVEEVNESEENEPVKTKKTKKNTKKKTPE